MHPDVNWLTFAALAACSCGVKSYRAFRIFALTEGSGRSVFRRAERRGTDRGAGPGACGALRSGSGDNAPCNTQPENDGDILADDNDNDGSCDFHGLSNSGAAQDDGPPPGDVSWLTRVRNWQTVVSVTADNDNIGDLIFYISRTGSGLDDCNFDLSTVPGTATVQDTSILDSLTASSGVDQVIVIYDESEFGDDVSPRQPPTTDFAMRDFVAFRLQRDVGALQDGPVGAVHRRMAGRSARRPDLTSQIRWCDNASASAKLERRHSGVAPVAIDEGLHGRKSMTAESHSPIRSQRLAFEASLMSDSQCCSISRWGAGVARRSGAAVSGDLPADLIRRPGYFDWERSARTGAGLGEIHARGRQQEQTQRRVRGRGFFVGIEGKRHLQFCIRRGVVGHWLGCLDASITEDRSGFWRFPSDEASQVSRNPTNPDKVVVTGGGALLRSARSSSGLVCTTKRKSAQATVGRPRGEESLRVLDPPCATGGSILCTL